MKALNYFFVLTIILLLSSCIKYDSVEPDVNFMINKGKIYVDDTVHFNNITTADGNCIWDFGDGITSTEKAPTHVYTRNGIYIVSLKIRGAVRKVSIIVDRREGEFFGKIGGLNIHLTDDDDGESHFSIAPHCLNCDGIAFSSIYKSNSINNRITISKGTLNYVAINGGDLPPDDVFKSYFNNNSCNYSDYSSDGIEITYKGNLGEEWTTRGDQTNSRFTFTYIFPLLVFAPGYRSNVVFYGASFDCNLYNSHGDLKTLTDGYMYFEFSNNL